MSKGRTLKFSHRSDDLQRVREQQGPKRLEGTELATGMPRSANFDTQDHRLRAGGLALLVTPTATGWLQTVKTVSEGLDGVSPMVETEVKGPRPNITAITDKAVRKRVKKAIGKKPLVPVFEAAEVEVASGDEEICDNATDTTSDFVNNEPKPLKASAPRLNLGQSSNEALPAIFRVATEQILHNWAVVLNSDDADGVHEMRIGLRRLRSALRVLRPVADDEELRAFNLVARDLARLIGEIRDADVLALEIVAPVAAKCQNDPSLASLKDVLDNKRAFIREKVRGELKSEKWSTLKLEFARLPEDIERIVRETTGKTRSKPVGALTKKALRKLWRSVAASGDRIDTLSVAERHQMRKDVKTLRYASELLGPLYRAKDVTQFTKKLQRLQDAFGYLNDVALADTLKQVHAPGFEDDPDLQRAVGFVIGWHTARAEHAVKDARAGWKRLAKSPQFWA
jgi:CHAD domain-containing protein